jgi:riboflavin kinase/FMN adenylyltransferase
LLKALGNQLGFAVHDLPAVACHGKAISSTRIRQAIVAGELGLAAEMLGRPYSIGGQVTRGDQLGRQLGFPTANLEISGLALPPRGVYAGYAQSNGHRYQAVINIGFRPTLDQTQALVRAEVHLLDFTGDLYDRELEFQFARLLRGEQKFPSLESLRTQIANDTATARSLLKPV